MQSPLLKPPIGILLIIPQGTNKCSITDPKREEESGREKSEMILLYNIMYGWWGSSFRFNTGREVGEISGIAFPYVAFEQTRRLDVYLVRNCL